MNSEHIKKFPLCFRAYLADISNLDIYSVDDEDTFPESCIGGYLNWFLEKKKFNVIESQLKEAREIIEELKTSNEFYANTASWESNAAASASTVVSSKDWESSREIPVIAKGFSVGGKLARRTKQATDQRIEKLKKEVLP